MAAFKAPGESVFGQGATILPQQWSLDSFAVLFERTNILGAIKNSAIIAALTVTSNIILSCIGGYMLSRRGWTGRTVMYFVVLSAMIFPFESIMLSLFKMMVQLDLYNTLPGVWMVAMIGPFQILMMRAAFMGIPDEIEDAALIDGAGELRRFWSIFLPQVRGTLTVVGLTSFIGAWSDFIFPLLMLPNPEKQTLMLTLTVIQNSPQGVTYQLVGRSSRRYDPRGPSLHVQSEVLLPWHRRRWFEVLISPLAGASAPARVFSTQKGGSVTKS